jgi:hypothetical protein
MADIDAISCDPEHRDQFKALKMLAAAKSSAVVLPEPMSDHDIVERISRLHTAAGPELTRLAYRKSFPRGIDIDETPSMTLNTLPPEVRGEAAKIVSIKMLYRAFPQVKRGGQPPGYPRAGSLAAQQDWCQRTAAQLILDREQARVNGTPKPEPPEAE